MKKNNIKKIILFLMAINMCLIPFFTGINMNEAYAEQQNETLEQKIERFTSSDLLDGENENGETIQTFSNKYKAGEYNLFFHDAYGYVITDIIKKVIPIELLYSIGTHVYMGKEYGIIVNTEVVEFDNEYMSEFLLIDFNISLEHRENFSNTDNMGYKMETTLNGELRTRIDDNEWEVYRPWRVNEFYVAARNPYLAFNLENEGEMNAYDTNYDIDNDSGGIIDNVRLSFSAHEGINFFTLEEK